MCDSRQPQDGAGAPPDPRRTVLVGGLGAAVWVQDTTCPQIAPLSGVVCVRRRNHAGIHEGCGGVRWSRA